MVFNKLDKPNEAVKAVVNKYDNRIKRKGKYYRCLHTNKERLIEWEKKYSKLYESYQKTGEIEKDNSIDKKSMVELYEYDKIHSILKEIILDPKINYCCICGVELVRPELDHVLPKSKFPQYAITPQNLVPICSDCNYFKGDGDGEYGNAVYNSYLENEENRENLVSNLFKNYKIDLANNKISEEDSLSLFHKSIVENYNIGERIKFKLKLMLKRITNQILFILDQSKENMSWNNISKEFLKDIIKSLEQDNDDIDNFVIRMILDNDESISYIFRKLEPRTEDIRKEFKELIKEEKIDNNNEHVRKILKNLGC